MWCPVYQEIWLHLDSILIWRVGIKCNTYMYYTYIFSLPPMLRHIMGFHGVPCIQLIRGDITYNFTDRHAIIPYTSFIVSTLHNRPSVITILNACGWQYWMTDTDIEVSLNNLGNTVLLLMRGNDNIPCVSKQYFVSLTGAKCKACTVKSAI